MRLRVATLNVWGLPEPLSVEPIRRLRAIGDGLPALSADVVAFQEVWFEGARRVLLEAGLRAGLTHSWSPTGRLGSSGLLVLSRFPFGSASLSTYYLRGLPEQVTHGDYYGGKGYVELVLSTPAGPVALVDTHLHARYTSDPKHGYVSYRVGQAVQLALGTRGIDLPLVAAGDFNFTQDSPEHLVFHGLSGLRDLAREAGDAVPTVLRANPFRRQSRKPDRRVDYVFARDGREAGVRVRKVQRVFDGLLEDQSLAYSNHAGVLAELEIGPAGPAAGASTGRAIGVARELLAEGRATAERRRMDQRTAAGAGLGAAALVAFGDRKLAANRRRFLRAGLQLTALAALAPSVGCSLLSEVFVPDEIRAFDRLAAALERLEAGMTRGRKP